MGHVQTIFASAALVSCAVAGSANAMPQDAPKQAVKSQKTDSFPFSDVVADPGQVIPADMYTRLVIERIDPKDSDGAEFVEYAGRNGFLRFVMGRNYAMNYTVKVNAARFAATVPILTFNHDSSSKKGEDFVREAEIAARDFPLFLLRSDGSADILAVEVEVKGSAGVKSAAASTALGISQRFLKVASPTSSLVTTLTEDKSRELAGALDLAISQLFATSVAERQRFDLDLRGGSALTIKLFMPEIEGKWRNPLLKLGTWRIGLAPPRPSVFDPVVYCAKAVGRDCSAPCPDQGCETDQQKARTTILQHVRARPGNVMAFKLFDGQESLGSIGKYLPTLAWWTSDVDLLVKPPVAGQPNSARQFCRRVRSAMTAIGLSTLDAQIVAETIGYSDIVPQQAAEVVAKSPDCQVPDSIFDASA